MISIISRQRLLSMPLPFIRIASTQVDRLHKFSCPGHIWSSNRTQSKYTKPNFVDDEWITIYKFPYMKAVASVTKVKTVTYLLSFIGPPAIYGFEYFAMIPHGCVDISLMMAFSGSIAMTSVGLFCKNLVGFAYVNQENQLLRLGYLTFWGRREGNFPVFLTYFVPIYRIS